MNRIESCNFEAGAAPAELADPCPTCPKGSVCRTPKCGRLKLHKPVSKPEPAGEEVGNGPDIKTKHGYPAYSVTQHQRLLEEAKQGQRVLAHELEQLKLAAKVAAADANEADAEARESFADYMEIKAELDALKAQEPYAIECGFDNGDGTYSVRIKRMPLPSYEKPHKDWPVRLLYASPVAQQKVVMPERKQQPELMMATYHEVRGWNACIDEVQRLNGAKP